MVNFTKGAEFSVQTLVNGFSLNICKAIAIWILNAIV